MLLAPIVLASAVLAPQRQDLREVARTRSNAELIDWLRDDEVRWNASAAGAELVQRLELREHQAELSRLFELRLDDRDLQVRKVAIGVLQRLIRASASLLRNYTTCTYPEWIPGTSTQREAVLFLLRCRPVAGAVLDRVLRQELDRCAPGQGWIYAYLLAAAGPSAPSEEIAPLLITHLRHNGVHDDALMCLNALYRLGPAIRLHARAALERSQDPQQRRALQLLLLELAGPAPSEAETQRRGALTRLTWKCLNPIRSWRFGRDSH